MRPPSFLLVVHLLAACVPPEPGPWQCVASRRQAVTRVCPGPALVTGLDVSVHEGPVDWARVKAEGHAFGLARVSDGLAFPDGRFEANWRGLRAAGLVRGAYQYFRPGAPVQAQVDLLLERVAAAGGLEPGDLPPVLDLEATDGLPAEGVRAAARAWLDAVEAATGRPPLVYTAAFMAPVLGTGFGRYPLWVANHGASCPALPEGWSRWRFWQYTAVGRSAGVGGPVDLDVFDGPLEALLAWSGAAPDGGVPAVASGAPPPPVPDAGPVEQGGGLDETVGAERCGP
jgi:lysozyme